MIFKSIEKIHQGEFITRYNIEYETKSGLIKSYEMISRDNNMNTHDKLKNGVTQAAVMIIHDSSGERILLNREFRMAVGTWVFNFPAGLIDEGESVLQAASRELMEETGLHLDRVDEIWKESYSAVGLSNEMCRVIVGTASGTIKESDSELEEIEARWYNKDEIRKMLNEELFAARAQTYCAVWSRRE